MKKLTLIIFILASLITLISCSVPTTIDNEIPQHTPVNTPSPTPQPTPEPKILEIEVELNNYHIRYFDDKETQFEIFVIGNIEDYEITFIPIEENDETPSLDENGLPETIGKYNVMIPFILNGDSDIYDPEIIVEIIERPSFFLQLYTPEYSDIPTNINIEFELITVEEDTTIETDYYVAHLSSGQEYSTWIFPLIDEIINHVHDLTGLYLPDSGEKFHLYFGEHNPMGTNFVSRRNVFTLQGDIIMYLTEWFSSYKDDIENWNGLINIIAHEFNHVLSWAFFNPKTLSFAHEEGNAVYIGFNVASFQTNFHSDFGWTDMIIEDEINRIIDISHNRLDIALSSHDGLKEQINLSRIYGGIFYMYLYENHGAEKAFEIVREMNSKRPSPPNTINTINEILNVEITETFPLWLDKNINNLYTELGFKIG